MNCLRSREEADLQRVDAGSETPSSEAKSKDKGDPRDFPPRGSTSLTMRL